MAVEAKRGCGHRKVGALYIVTSGLGEPCERLPIPIVPCPTCGERIKQTRGFQWLKVEMAFAGAKACAFKPSHCPRCMVCQPVLLEREGDPKDKVGLIFVGEKYYPTPEAWTQEARQLGVSRRISTIPKGLVLGKTLVLAAHPTAITVTEKAKGDGDLVETEKEVGKPGIFYGFIPHRIELIVTPSMTKERWVTKLVEKQGVTLVEVPEDDPDHAPTLSKKSGRKRAMDKHARKLAPKKKEKAAADA